jgi:hypothetical protein
VLLHSATPLEELDSAFVFLGLLQCVERPEIPSPARLGIDFSRIQTINARLKFSNHAIFSVNQYQSLRVRHGLLRTGDKD